jgi:hypothetical protein
LHHLPGRADHRAGDHLQELGIVDVQCVTLGPVEGEGAVGVGGGDLAGEELEGFLAGSADALVDVAGPRLHLLVHPITAGVAVDDADALADRVEHELGLLGDQRPLEGEEVAGVGENGVEFVVSEGFERLVDGGNLCHLAAGPKGLEEAGVRGRLTGEDQYFGALTFQAVAAQTSKAAEGVLKNPPPGGHRTIPGRRSYFVKDLSVNKKRP